MRGLAAICSVLVALESLAAASEAARVGRETVVEVEAADGVGGALKVISPSGKEVEHEEWRSGGSVKVFFKPSEPGVHKVASAQGATLGEVIVKGAGLREAAMLFGGLFIFLYAMREITQSLRKAVGGTLRGLLEKFASSKVLGAGVGVVLSVGMQSSTTATVLVVGLAGAGLMTLAHAVPVMIGASLGTAATIQIIAFDFSDYALLITGLGALAALAAPYRIWECAGRVVLGFGLIFLGMGWMRAGTEPLQYSAHVAAALKGVGHSPVLAFAIFAVFTAAVQSSAAAIAVVMTFAAAGLFGETSVVAALLGAHLGTAVMPLISAIGSPRIAGQVAAATFVYKVCGVILTAPIVWLVAAAADRVGWDLAEPHGIANVFTALNAAWAVIFLPVSGLMAKLAGALVPARAGEKAARVLDPGLLSDPRSAVSALAAEASRIAGLVREAVQEVPAALFDYSSVELEKLERRDELVDDLHKASVRYAREIAARGLAEDEAQGLGCVLYILRGLEATGDLVSKDIVLVGYKRLDKDKSFSMGDMAAIRRFVGEVVKALEQIEVGLLVAARVGFPIGTGGKGFELAQFAAHSAGVMREFLGIHAAHFEAMSSGVPEALMDDSVFIDTISILRQMYTLVGDMAGVLVNPPEMTGFFHPRETSEGKQ